MLLVLQTRGGVTAAELAARLEVSPRTVYRDAEALSDAGLGGGRPVGCLIGDGAGADADEWVDVPLRFAAVKAARPLLSFGDDVVVFHAGVTRGADGTLLSSGGRVLNVCARAPTVGEARDRAYAAVDRIDFPGGFHRRDIAWRALG